MAGLILFTFLLLMTFFTEFKRQSHFIKIDGHLGISLTYGFVYAYVGILALTINPINGFTGSTNFGTYAALIAILSFLLCKFGYAFGSSGTRHYLQCKRRLVPNSIVLLCGKITFFLGLFSLFSFTATYGGVQQTIRSSAAIRAGFSEYYMVGSGKLLFLVNLIPLCQFLPLILLALLVKGNRSRELKIWLLGSASFALFALTLMSGRARILNFFLSAILILYYYRRKTIRFSFRTTAYCSIILFAFDYFVAKGKRFFLVMGKDDSRLFSSDFLLDYIPFQAAVDNYEFSISSIRVASLDTKFGPTLFYDLFYSPFYVIPSWLSPLTPPDSIAYINTYLLTNVWESSIPPGIAAYGLYSAGILGVILVSFFYGYCPGRIDSISKLPTNYDIFTVVWTRVFMVQWLVGACSGEPRVCLRSLIYIFAFVIIAYCIRGIKHQDGRSQSRLY